MKNNSRLKAPFPWFGGKSRVAHLVWERFGNVRNYVEPFAGSLAVLLGRPTEPKIETVNDLDCWIANFWRALRADPEQVAHWADWPVNEADLHARHLWLVKQAEFRERMKTDPDHFDCKIAGWWVWGISQWIGGGWCAEPQRRGQTNAGRAARGIHTETAQKRPYLGGGMGVHGSLAKKRPRLGNDHGRGVLCADVPNPIPDLSGDAGVAGQGINASGLPKGWAGGLPYLRRAGMGIHQQGECFESTSIRELGGLYGWFHALADRLRRVRVCCGDWKRVLGPAPTTCIGTTGVFLDPPYAVDDRSDVYNEESRDVAHNVREWALANGDNPELRIALCGYEGEHAMPSSWTEVAWKSSGGFTGRGKQNAYRERVWFSPHCLKRRRTLLEL